MKEHQKELLIVPLNSNIDNTKFTAQILYNNYQIGIFQLEKTIFPPLNTGLGAPFNSKYYYTLIFDEKCKNKSLNIGMNSIETNGWFQINNGTLQNFNLGLPLGIYKNIGISTEGFRYNLKLINEENKTIIMLNRIC